MRTGGWAFGMPDTSVTDTAEDAHGKPTAAMWDRKKNDPINSGLMSEKEIFQDQILFASRDGQAIQAWSRRRSTERRPCLILECVPAILPCCER